MPAIRALAYYRMSDPQQEESIDQQRAEVVAYAARRGYQIIREYVDEGISGDKTEKRAGFLKMRDEASRLGVEAILVWDQDRFGRFDSLEAGYWIKPLRDAGIVLVTVKDGAIDWNDFTKRLVYTITQEGKHQYLRDISRNITRGQLANARKGRRNGSHAPYGYDRMLLDELRQPRQRLRPGERVIRPKSWDVTLVPSENPEEVETVVWIFRTFLDTEGSLRGMANELNRRGVRAPGRYRRGDRAWPLWDTNAIKRVLTNPVYCGDYRYGYVGSGSYHRIVGDEVREHKGKRCRRKNDRAACIIRDAHESLVSRQAWDLAQAKLAARKAESRYVRDAGYVLTGLLYCGHCGSRMQGTSAACRAPRNGKAYAYRRYICQSSRTKGVAVCLAYSLREDVLLPFLVRKLQEEYLAPDKVERLRERLRERLATPRPGQTLPTADQLRDRLAKLDEEIKRASLNVLRAQDNIDLLNEALTGLRHERDGLALDLRDAEARGEPEVDVEATVEEAVGRLRTLGERMNEADPVRLRHVLRQMIARIDLYYERPEGRKRRAWFRLEKGIVKLKPQVEFAGCAAASPRLARSRSAS
jgi:DNA invertase Pin-like site-specific DNA recombinase